MELQFHKNTCRCLSRGVREIRTEELTQEVRLSDGMPDIGRVLSCWGQVILRGKEWRAGNATVSGGVMLWVLYAPEDGSAPRCEDTWIPFSLNWDVAETDREGIIRVMPLLRFADSRALSARKLMVRAGLAAMGDILYPVDVEIAQAEEVPEDVELLKRSYPIRIPKEAGEKTFVLDEDLPIPEPAPEKLLCYTLQPEITEKRIMAGKAVFRGNGNLHILYRCSDGQLRTWDYELPFSQFQDLDEEFDAEAFLGGDLAVTSMEVDAEEGHLRLKCGMVFQYVVDGCFMVELAQDAYSPGRTVETSMEELRLPSVLDERREIITAEQSIPGQQGRVVDVCFLPDFPRQRRDGDMIRFELPGMFQVLYYGDDDSVQSASARWEGNFALGAGEDSSVHSLAAAVGRPAASASGDGMDLRGQLRLSIGTTSDRGIPMVTGIEAGELREPDPNRPSLILCRCDGDLWSLAKRCGSSIDAIRRANSLEDEPENGRILLIPVS